MESSWRAGDGWPIRRIDWPAPSGKPRGALLFMPGRGDFYEKYLDVLAHWHALGWQVSAADWRGQGASGRLGNDAVTGHIDDYTTWIGDLAAFWRDWKRARPGPHVLAGHSMGGHLVLRATGEGAVDPDGLLLCAPMLGFAASLLPVGVMHPLARLMAAIGDDRRPAWKWSEKPGEPPAERMRLLTHDPERYEDEMWWRRERPELLIGPGSWRWVERGYASMEVIDGAGFLEQIQQPTLILASAADKLVSFAAIARAARRLPQCRFERFGPEAAHEILREEPVVRGRALDACDVFLAGLSGD